MMHDVSEAEASIQEYGSTQRKSRAIPTENRLSDFTSPLPVQFPFRLLPPGRPPEGDRTTSGGVSLAGRLGDGRTISVCMSARPSRVLAFVLRIPNNHNLQPRPGACDRNSAERSGNADRLAVPWSSIRAFLAAEGTTPLGPLSAKTRVPSCKLCTRWGFP